MLRFNATAVTRDKTHAAVGNVQVYTWSLAGGETGDPAIIPWYSDVTVQLRTYSGSGDITIEGSAEAPGGSGVFGALDDAQGVAIALNAVGQAEIVLQNVYQLQPVAGASAVGIVVALVR